MTPTPPSPPLPETETPYGMLKRFAYVNAVIDACQPQAVLDIGCGTGAYLTRPLAQRHSGSLFCGTDSDTASIDLAKRSGALPNLEFSTDPDIFRHRQFQVIIASEVLEHVDDPLAFLRQIRSTLTDDGKVVLTVPNGYGPFEIATFLETLLRLSGLYKIAVALARLVRNKRPFFPKSETLSAESLAISPHINFFSLGVLKSLIAASGFRISSFRPRTLLCGPLFDQIIQGLEVQNWNARVADHTAPTLASDWMFVLEPTGEPSPFVYRRRLDARMRRLLNEKKLDYARRRS